MKPEQIRALKAQARAWQESVDEDRVRRLRGDVQPVVADLIPTEADRLGARRTARALIRRLDATPQGARRAKLLDALMAEMAKLVYLERVMALDPLERAGLRPGQLQAMQMVSRADLMTMQGKLMREGLG